MLATVAAASIFGVEGCPVHVEVHVSNGLPGYSIVGLPDTSCRESRDRVRAALLSSGLAWPAQRITVNLAPSGVRKAGAGLDLAIAVGLLVASGQIELPADALARRGFIGELGLDGSVRPITGALPMAGVITTDELVVAAANHPEVALLERHLVRPVRHLRELVDALVGKGAWPDPDPPVPEPAGPPPADLAEVRGQLVARRALEIAAAGGHHLLLVGPPGGGKTMLAERLPGLLGQLTPEAALRVTTIHSAAGAPLPRTGLLRIPPFRAPHHSSTQAAMIGGGTAALRPGEISLASEGVLFLDELGEFPQKVIDSLRQPLESGSVNVSRARDAVTLPASFLLVAAMNPCPCGYAPTPACSCTEAQLARYARRVSGPILDRLDLRVTVAPTARVELLGGDRGETSAEVALRVVAARSRARSRGVAANSLLRGTQLDQHCTLDGGAVSLLEDALDRGRISGRGLQRTKAVALTIDDLRGGSGTIDRTVLAEALGFRASLDLTHSVRGAA